MSSVDFDKIWFKKLEMTDDLTAFKCDTDDDSGCDEFIHKAEEAKLSKKKDMESHISFFAKKQ
jgi:hypothetical protein